MSLSKRAGCEERGWYERACRYWRRVDDYDCRGRWDWKGTKPRHTVAARLTSSREVGRVRSDMARLLQTRDVPVSAQSHMCVVAMLYLPDRDKVCPYAGQLSLPL